MKIIIQARSLLGKEELEQMEKELTEKLECKVIILQPKLEAETLRIIDDCKKSDESKV